MKLADRRIRRVAVSSVEVLHDGTAKIRFQDLDDPKLTYYHVAKSYQKEPDWQPLIGDRYKSFWCAPCTGGSDQPGVWAHWIRRDGFTVCGHFHKPEDFPIQSDLSTADEHSD